MTTKNTAKKPSKRQQIAVVEPDEIDNEPIVGDEVETPEPSVFDLLDQLQGYKFLLFRVHPSGQKAFIQEYIGDAFQLDTVRANYGGGDYLVQRRTLENRYDKQHRFSIDGPPRTGPVFAAAPAGTANAHPQTGAAPAVDPIALLTAEIKALREDKARDDGRVTVKDLLPLFAQKPAESNMLPLLQLFMPLLAHKPQPIADTISALQAVDQMRGGAPSGGGSEPGENFGQTIAAIMEALPAAAAGLEKMGWTKPAAPAPVPATAPQAVQRVPIQHAPQQHAPHQLPQRSPQTPPLPASPAVAPAAESPAAGSATQPLPPAADPGPAAAPAAGAADPLVALLTLGAQKFDLAEDDEERAYVADTYAQIVVDALEASSVDVDAVASDAAAATGLLKQVAPALSDAFIARLVQSVRDAAGDDAPDEPASNGVAGKIGGGA